MAFVFHHGESNATAAFTWINENFQYYGRSTSKALAEQLRDEKNGAYNGAKRLLDSIDKVLTTVEVPFRELKGPFDGNRIFARPLKQEKKARRKVSLRKLVPLLYEVARESTSGRSYFNFFGLPAELRNKIYELSFGYDKGLKVRSCAGALQRLCAVPFGDPKEPLFHETYPTTRPMSQILGPLQTCRQFYNEAMPAFYRVNFFYFSSFGDLASFLNKIPANRKEHIANLSAEYQTTDSHHGPKGFRLLAGLKNLQVLGLNIDEKGWLRKLAYPTKFDDLTEKDKDKLIWKLPGLTALRSIRGLQQVKFYGPCIRVKALVKPEVRKPKEDCKTSDADRKRKARDDRAVLSKGGKAKKTKTA